MIFDLFSLIIASSKLCSLSLKIPILSQKIIHYLKKSLPKISAEADLHRFTNACPMSYSKRAHHITVVGIDQKSRNFILVGPMPRVAEILIRTHGYFQTIKGLRYQSAGAVLAFQHPNFYLVPFNLRSALEHHFANQASS